MSNDIEKKIVKKTFEVEGVEYEIPDRFTLGELADIEEITGQAYDPEKSGARMTLAIVYIAMRQKDPTVKLADVRGFDMGELVFPEDAEEETSPPGQEPSETPELASAATPEPSGAQP